VLIALFVGRGNTGGQDRAGFRGARLSHQQLRVHQVGRDVFRVALQQSAEVLIRGGGIATIHALHSEAVAGECVVRLFRDELFEHLPAGFLLFAHGHICIIPMPRIVLNAETDDMKAKKSKKTPDDGLAGKPVSASRSEMAEVVLPAQTNPLGKLLGGHVMHLVDIAAAMAAHRHSNSYVVTASVDYIDFRNSVSLGEIVMLESQVNRVFHTSMEVGVEVYSENVLTGERKHTTSAYVTFVAIDEKTHRPKPVRPLLVKTSEEKRRYEEAAERRKTRLALRYRENDRPLS